MEGGLEGGECRLRSPQSLLSDEHLCGNPLGLAVHDDCHIVLILGHFHDNLLRLGVGVLGGDDLGDGRAVFSVLLPHQLLRLVPGPAR